jgi:hypothetical protein
MTGFQVQRMSHAGSGTEAQKAQSFSVPSFTGAVGPPNKPALGVPGTVFEKKNKRCHRPEEQHSHQHLPPLSLPKFMAYVRIAQDCI